MQEARQEIPPETYTPEELAFAQEINRAAPGYEEGVTPPIDTSDTLNHKDIYGSTDYGDVQHICPGFQVRTACAPTLSRGHSWMMTASCGSSLGMKGMLRAAKIMAVAAYKIMSDPARLDAMRMEFRKMMGGKIYESPLSEDIPWPYQ